MKRIFLLHIIIIVISCTDKNIGKSITGNLNGAENNFFVVLDSIDSNQKNFAIDSVRIVNNSFRFNLSNNIKTKHYQIRVISDSLQRPICNIPVWIQNENVSIEGCLNKKKMYFDLIKVSGGQLNKIQNKFRHILSKYDDGIQRELSLKSNKGKEDSILNKYKILIEKDQIKLIFREPNNVISLENMLRFSGRISKDSLVLYYSLLDNKLKSSKNGKIVFEQKKVNKLKVGFRIENFTAFDLNKKEIAISEFKGKIILLDFWASWCVPCHEQNQKEFSKLHEKYKNKNFALISYSLDRKEDAKKWKKASQKDKIDWINISNLKGFNDPISKQYNISSIPHSFLIDQNGIIIKSFRGYDPKNRIIESEILKLMK